MKNLKLLFLALLLTITPNLMAQSSKPVDSEIGISTSFYANLNEKVADNTFSNITLDYRISKLFGVQLSTGCTNNWTKDNLFAYTISAGICCYPDFKSRFSMVPSIGIGVSGGAIAGIPDKKLGYMMELGVLAKYDLTDSFYCGFDVRSMFCREHVSIFVAGFRIGYTFKWARS